MNGDFYDSLTDEQKGWIDQAVEACTEEERQVVYRMFKESKEKVIADGAEVTNLKMLISMHSRLWLFQSRISSQLITT